MITATIGLSDYSDFNWETDARTYFASCIGRFWFFSPGSLGGMVHFPVLLLSFYPKNGNGYSASSGLLGLIPAFRL